MKQFVGMIIPMGHHQVPQLEDYWTSDSLLAAPGIVKGISIDRFKVLLQCLHVNNNTTAKSRNDPNYDRLHKILPLLNISRDISCMSSKIFTGKSVLMKQWWV